MQKLLTIRSIAIAALLGVFLSACNQVLDINDVVDLSQGDLSEFLHEVIENMQEETKFALSGKMFNGDSFEGLFDGDNFYLKSKSDDDQSEVYGVDGDVYVYADVSGNGLEWVKFASEEEAADFTKDIAQAADFFGDDTSDSALIEQYLYKGKELCPSGQRVCYRFEIQDTDETLDQVYFDAVTKLPEKLIDTTEEGKTEVSFDYESGINIVLPDDARSAKSLQELLSQP